MDTVSKIKGQWWLPDKPDRKVTGELEFGWTSGATLKLDGSFFDDAFPPEDTLPDGLTVLGEDRHERPITLFDCLVRKLELHPTNSVAELESSFGILGKHFASRDDVQVSAVSIELNHLHRWVGETGISSGFDKDGSSWAKHHPHAPISIGSHNGFDISLRFTAGYSRSSSEYRVWEKCLLWIEGQSSSPYGDFEDIAEWMRQFLALAMGRPIYPMRVRARPQNPRKIIQDPPMYEELEIFWDLFVDEDGKKPLAPHEMLFRLEHIRHDPLAFTGQFFEKRGRLEPVCELYLSTLYNSRMYLPQRFLTLAQAVEGYHRIFETPGEYQPKETYMKGLRAKLLEMVPDAINNDFKEAIRGHLDHMHEFTLKKRIETLHEKFAGILRTYLGEDGKKFSRAIKDLRNKLTHPDVRSDIEWSSINSADLWLKCEQLSLLLQVCLLDQLGFDETAIQDMIRRGRHAQTILRFAVF